LHHERGAKRESIIGHSGVVASVVASGDTQRISAAFASRHERTGRAIRRMPNSQQRELLFYMIAHATKGVMLLQQALDPENKSGMNYHDMNPTKQ